MNFYFYLSKILSPILSLTNFLFIFLFVNLIIYFFLKKKIIQINIFFSLIVIFTISFFPIGNFLLISLEKKYYKQKHINYIDAIVVLAGSEDPINTKTFGKLHLNGASERLIEFVKLSYKYNNIDKIFLGGTPYLNDKNILSEVDVAKVFFKNINFDTSQVIFLNNSRNTIENLDSLKVFNKKKNYRYILLITSASHMKRSIFVAEKFGLNVIPYAVDFKTRPNKDLNILVNWQGFNVLSNLQEINIFFSEYLAFLALKIFL